METNGNKKALLDKWVKGECSPEERMDILGWLGNDQPDEDTREIIEQWFSKSIDTSQLDPEIIASLEAKLPLILSKQHEEVVVHHINTRRRWLPYAAAVLIVLLGGTYFYFNRPTSNEVVHTPDPVPMQNDVAPGGNRATLTLADGTKILLDSVVDGVVATQGDIAIQKNNNKIIYPSLREGSGVGLKDIAYNTMTTPRGGQFQLTLPDGSQVWLNAESSITYPTAFTGKKREVSITGEAYFEVAKDKSKPFIVSVNRENNTSLNTEKEFPSQREGSGVGSKNLEIEVLGTHFNINTYKEEPTKNITLIEGSVRVTTHHSPLTAVLTLKPGQQGQWNPTSENLSLAVHPDVEQVMAWKNGTFYFQSADLKTIMIQLARWYDLEVVYGGNVPERRFSGEIDRSLTLAQVLNGLTQTRIKYQIQGNKITILP